MAALNGDGVDQANTGRVKLVFRNSRLQGR